MLSYLCPDPAVSVAIQDSEFTKDLLGRYVCSTLDEAVNNGGRPFDVVVIGAGMFGAYLAEKIYRRCCGRCPKFSVCQLRGYGIIDAKKGAIRTIWRSSPRTIPDTWTTPQRASRTR
jgi:hypothetical protein